MNNVSTTLPFYISDEEVSFDWSHHWIFSTDSELRVNRLCSFI